MFNGEKCAFNKFTIHDYYKVLVGYTLRTYNKWNNSTGAHGHGSRCAGKQKFYIYKKQLMRKFKSCSAFFVIFKLFKLFFYLTHSLFVKITFFRVYYLKIAVYLPNYSLSESYFWIQSWGKKMFLEVKAETVVFLNEWLFRVWSEWKIKGLRVDVARQKKQRSRKLLGSRCLRGGCGAQTEHLLLAAMLMTVEVAVRGDVRGAMCRPHEFDYHHGGVREREREREWLQEKWNMCVYVCTLRQLKVFWYEVLYSSTSALSLSSSYTASLLTSS